MVLHVNQNQIQEAFSLSVVTIGLGVHSSIHFISLLLKSGYKLPPVEEMSETDL